MPFSYIVLFLWTIHAAQFLFFNLGFPYSLKLSVSISLLRLNWMSIVTGMQTAENTHHSASLTTSISTSEEPTPVWAIPNVI